MTQENSAFLKISSLKWINKTKNLTSLKRLQVQLIVLFWVFMDIFWLGTT